MSTPSMERSEGMRSVPMGMRGNEQIAAQPTEQVRQMLLLNPAAGRRCLAHAVQQFQKMGVDTACRVGADPEMCGDVFDQRRMKRLRAWIVQTRVQCAELVGCMCRANVRKQDRKSTRLNSSHSQISYAVFCLKKKKNIQRTHVA